LGRIAGPPLSGSPFSPSSATTLWPRPSSEALSSASSPPPPLLSTGSLHHVQICDLRGIHGSTGWVSKPCSVIPNSTTAACVPPTVQAPTKPPNTSCPRLPRPPSLSHGRRTCCTTLPAPRPSRLAAGQWAPLRLCVMSASQTRAPRSLRAASSTSPPPASSPPTPHREASPRASSSRTSFASHPRSLSSTSPPLPVTPGKYYSRVRVDGCNTTLR